MVGLKQNKGGKIMFVFWLCVLVLGIYFFIGSYVIIGELKGDDDFNIAMSFAIFGIVSTLIMGPLFYWVVGHFK